MVVFKMRFKFSYYFGLFKYDFFIFLAYSCIARCALASIVTIKYRYQRYHRMKLSNVAIGGSTFKYP